ncbi:TPA: hypothetical protein DEG75_00190 [Candidatus Dependentiae bacterium]|nr:hypothetical protein [Candidatus Dependentiae bacterium]
MKKTAKYKKTRLQKGFLMFKNRLFIFALIFACFVNNHKTIASHNSSLEERELVCAIHKKSLENVQKWSGFIQDINKPIEGFTPLQFACWKGCSDIVQFLVEEKKATIDLETERFPWPPFYLACLYGHSTIIEYLFSKTDQKLTLWELFNKYAQEDALFEK